MSVVAPQHIFQNLELERVASSLRAAKEYEGSGRILHDSYDKQAYIKRRHGFLGRHPDYKSDPKLLPNVTRGAEQVFDAQPDDLSVEQVRTRELIYEIEPLLPFPTSTNTESLDNFRSFGMKEWTTETGHPTHLSPSPQPSPRMSTTEPNIEVPISPQQISTAPLGLGGSVSDTRINDSSAGQNLRRPRQIIFASPDSEYPSQQTGTNMTFQYQSSNAFNRNSQAPWSSAMNLPQDALNVPEDAETLRKIIADLGKDGLTPADQPAQYQRTHRPQMQVSAVAGRPLEISVKKPPPRGNKRTAPVNSEEENVEQSGEDQHITKQPKKSARPAAKKAKVTVTAGEDYESPKKTNRTIATKAPRQAPPITAPKSTTKGKARVPQTTPSATSTVSDIKSTKRAPRRTTAGKAPPQQSGSAAPAAIARRRSHPGTVNGTRIPKTKTEAAEAAVERRQVLLSELLAKKRTVRHPDLGPEFFDTANFTEVEKDPNGDPPVRCVCGKIVDDGKYQGDWIGCDNEECRVWQHVPCMGEAVPAEDARETSKYLCQQCDPWAHRKLIQTLRRAHPLPT